MTESKFTDAAGRPGTTLHAIVAQAVAGDIESGRYPVGTVIPTEAELCRRYAVSRNTVRQALNTLKQQGLISSHAGVGTTVRSKPQANRFASSLSEISDLLQFVGNTRMIIASQREIEADEQMASLLECEVGQAWREIRCIRHLRVTDSPLGFVTVYVRSEFSSPIKNQTVIEKPVYAMLEEHFGLQIVEVRQSIGAHALPPDIATQLNAVAEEPALHIIRHFFDKNMRTIEVSVGYFPQNRYRQESRFRATTSLPTKKTT